MYISWLTRVDQLLQKEQLDKDDTSWSAHFAHLQYSVHHPPTISALMPLFRDNAHSVSMVKHGMDIIMKAIQLVNPGQNSVLTLDQPLYAIAKEIQWSWLSTYGKQNYVVLMGGLHKEMALLKVLGKCLEGSGWVAIMASANVTIVGRADALQSGSHTSRAQRAHQVTAAALFCLQHQAYTAYQESLQADDLEVNYLMSGVLTWKMATHNSYFGVKFCSLLLVSAITTRRKLLDVCVSTGEYHTLDVGYGSFPLFKVAGFERPHTAGM